MRSDTPAVSRRLATLALVAHLLLAAWLLVNGVAHTVSVIAKANAETLSAGASATSLVAVGVGLALSGAFVAASSRTLWRAARGDVGATLGLPWASLGSVAVVLLGIGIAYGPGLLRGSLVFLLIDSALIGMLVYAGRPRATARSV